MSVIKLLFSGRILRRGLLYRTATKFYSTESPKEDTKIKEKGLIDEKPVALLAASAPASQPKRLYSSDSLPNDCADGRAGSEGNPSDGIKKGLVLGVYEAGDKFELTPAAEEVNQKSGGKLCQHLSELSCELKLGKAFVVGPLAEYGSVALASLGRRDAGFDELEQLDVARENVRWGIGAGVRELRRRGAGRVRVDPAAAPDAAAEAAELAAWRFEEFKSCGAITPQSSVSLFGTTGAELWKIGATRARAQNWARYLSDMPANNMTPTDLAQAALDVLCPLGVRVEARDRQWIETQRMDAFLAVARGSCEEPMFLECEYRGGRDTQPPVLVVAKGVTFDSGGLCLKPAANMADNRGSMAGAAVALAALRILAELKVPLNVVACIPLCENMVSGQAMRVGDVVRALNGLSIQIEDTDMEGRLMLADALVYGQALYKPSLVIDVGTLTHGVLLATGGGAWGCFSNSEAAWRAVRRAGALSGERPWRLPLWRYYHAQITDDPAVDLRNKGSGSASACLGAAFLKNFICGDWIHMDITGVGKTAHAAPPYLRARRMSGRPTRALALTLEHVADACRAKDGDKKAITSSASK